MSTIKNFALDKRYTKIYNFINMIKKVLLAAKVSPDDPDLALRQLGNLHYPVMLSAKIDGIRCHIERSDSVELPLVLSRKNKFIPNSFIQKRLSHSQYIGLDGELVVGKANAHDCFNRSQSGAMSCGGDPDFRFFVFDWTDELGKFMFIERYRDLQNRFETRLKNDPRVMLIPQTVANNVDDLLAFETKMLSKGWEGIMSRSFSGRYKQGRSTLNEQILIKVKRFVDGEAEILGCYEQQTNLNLAVTDDTGRSKRSSHKANKINNGHLGGFHVRDVKTGVEFDIGTMDGITKAQRLTMWGAFCEEPSLLLGKTVKYKKFPIGEKDKPRHPILCGFRDPIDTGEPNEISE